MLPYGKPTLLLAAAALLATFDTAHAADTFTWDPRSVKLNGKQFTADTLVLGDYAKITFGFDGQNVTFQDRGYMPVLGFTLQGRIVRPSGFNAPGGTGWGAYIDYTASGTQSFSAPGVPVNATFTRLDYSIIGYNGTAVFSLDADGTPMIGGKVRQVGTLGTGSLIQGGLDYLPGPAGLTINGLATTTIMGVPGQVGGSGTTGFDVSFVHPPTEYVSRPDLGTMGAILIPGNGSSSTAVFQTRAGASTRMAAFAPSSPAQTAAAATDVPEPGMALLVGAGLLSLGWLRRRGG